MCRKLNNEGFLGATIKHPKRGISLKVKLDVTAITIVVRVYDASSIVSFIMSILNMFRII